MNSIIIMLKEKRADWDKKLKEAQSRMERQLAALQGYENEVASYQAELVKIDDAISVLTQAMEQSKAVQQ